MHSDDRQLVERLRAGDAPAFRAFFDEYFDRLYRFAMSRTRGDRDLSQEAAQRALCRAVRRLETYRGEAALFTWLAQICRNELADLITDARRAGSRTVSIDASPRVRAEAEAVAQPAAQNPAAGPEAMDRTRVVRAVLDHLPGRYGEVLEWKYMDDLSVHDIAIRLRATFEATQSLLARARLAFRSELVARGFDAGDLGI